MPSPSPRSSAAAGGPFTHSWIQALTAVAEHPLARSIKPTLELVNSLALARGVADQTAAASQLWQLAQEHGLSELLGVVPQAQATWVFDSSDIFAYQRPATDVFLSLAQAGGPWNFEAWQQALGLAPTHVALTAEVFAGDWTSLVRQEAVRLQQSFKMSAVEQATTVRLACTARWDQKRWSVQFDQVPWVVVTYDDLPHMPRPASGPLCDWLLGLVGTAGQAQVTAHSGGCEFQLEKPAWYQCVEPLSELHQCLGEAQGGFSPWLVRAWHCIWPVVYREQQVLHERADIGHIRSELAACVQAQPRLCLWMFLFAKLVCQTQLGSGLGCCADYRD